MTKKNQNIEFYQGDTVDLDVTVIDEEGAAQNIAGATIAWVLYDENTQTATLTKNTTSGITITSGLDGEYTVSLTPSDTGSITPGDYYHESEITDSTGHVSTVFTGYVTVLPSRI